MANIKQMWKSITMGGLSRLKGLSVLTPGYKYKGESQDLSPFLWRLPELEVYSRYMDNLQYDHLGDWAGDLTDQQNDVRTRKPKKIYPLPQIASDIFCSLVTSDEARLQITSEDDETQEKIDDFLEKTMFWACVGSAFRSFYANGSMFIRFYVSPNNEKILMEPHNTKSCWPTFDDNNELESVVIRYVYDTGEVDEKTKEPIWRWAQYELGKEKDIEYDNPIFKHEEMKLPKFTPETTITHNLGFVQGIWIKNGFNPSGDDGRSYLEAALDYLDDLNYLSSKESNSIYHALYPTLVGFGVDGEDFEKMIGSGPDADGNISGGSSFITTEKPPNEAGLQFLETSNKGIDSSENFIQRNLQMLQHIFKVTLPNPEVLLGYAQSAEAMKMLYRPLIEEVKRMRPFLKEGICELLEKMEVVSKDVPFGLKPGTIEESKKKWGEMVTATETDKAQRVSTTEIAINMRAISRKTATEHIAPDFGIKNVEDEIKQIESEGQQDMEEEILSFKTQSDIEAKNNPKPAPKPAAKPKPKGGKK